MLVTTRSAIGLRIDPQAPPKEMLCYGPMAGYGSIDWSGSINEHIELVAETPAPPALSTAYVFCSLEVELGDSFTKTGLLKYLRTHLTISSTT